MYIRRYRRWSGENDKHFGPFITVAKREHGSDKIGVMLDSGDDERRGCCLQLDGFGWTVILELPPIIKPWRRWVDTTGRCGDARSGYWDTHERNYGFYVFDGHFYVALGAQTHDSTTTQKWSCFLPWTQRRFIRHSYYGLDGELFFTSDGRGGFGSDAYQAERAAHDNCPKARFEFKDYDDSVIIATTMIEEREWAFGTGWFKWLSWFRQNRIRRSLDLQFSAEVGPEKGSWKGGTLGHGIDMLPGELHQAAFERYCSAEHEHRRQKYGLTFVRRIWP